MYNSGSFEVLFFYLLDAISVIETGRFSLQLKQTKKIKYII